MMPWCVFLAATYLVMGICWATGDEVRGLAKYWDMVHEYLAQLISTDAKVRAAALVVRFETICDQPEAQPEVENLVARHSPSIRYPTYYQSRFSEKDLEIIEKETAATARLWGFE
jgi:hypothetical protein